MADLPQFVEMHEEGPREGFQMETVLHPLERRGSLIDALARTGLTHIQIGSLVSPKAVPTMADTPELLAAIDRQPGVHYTALWLNRRGFLRALELPGLSMDGHLYFYASNGLAQRNNNRTADAMRDEQLEFVRMYEEHGVPVTTAGIMCAFGCNFDGDIPEARVTGLLPWIREITVGRGHPLPTLMLCDTMGWANPEAVRRLIGAVREREPAQRIGMHIHDTRGLGLANFHAALEMGVDVFDASIGGLGGCPFAGNSNARTAGNICTEDAVFMCHELGIETGIDLEGLIEAARMAESILGFVLPGRIMHSGSLARFRGRQA